MARDSLSGMQTSLMSQLEYTFSEIWRCNVVISLRNETSSRHRAAGRKATQLFTSELNYCRTQCDSLLEEALNETVSVLRTL